MSNYERCYLIALHLVIVRGASVDTLGFQSMPRGSSESRGLLRTQNGSATVGALARNNPAREPREKHDRAERD